MGVNPAAAAAALAAFCFPSTGEEEGLDGGKSLAETQRGRCLSVFDLLDRLMKTSPLHVPLNACFGGI